MPSPSAQRDPDRVRRAFAALEQYYRWTRVLPAGAALDRILEHTGYLALAATTPGGVEAGDLLHAVDRVRQVVEEGGSLADAADALEADSEASNEVESLPLEPGRTDVVRLMNLHKAKGLEADVVFLADPCGGFKPRVDVHIERDGAQGARLVQGRRRSPRGSFAAKLLGEHADWAAARGRRSCRISRPRRTGCSMSPPPARARCSSSAAGLAAKGTPAWGVLNDFLAPAKELAGSAQRAASPVRSRRSARVRRRLTRAAARRGARDGRVNAASWSITSVTAEAHHIAKMTAHGATAAADDPTHVVAPDTPSHRADAGMAWGTLIHGLLEHAMRHRTRRRDDLRRLAMWLTVEEPQLRAVIDEALETVQRVAKADFWAEAQAGEHSEEAPFAVVEAGALTNGVIDLLFDSAPAGRSRLQDGLGP